MRRHRILFSCPYEHTAVPRGLRCNYRSYKHISKCSSCAVGAQCEIVDSCIFALCRNGPFAFRGLSSCNTFLALELIFGQFVLAQLSQLTTAEGIGGEALSPAFAARQRSRPGSSNSIHHSEFLVIVVCAILTQPGRVEGTRRVTVDAFNTG